MNECQKKPIRCEICGICCYDHTVLVTFRDLREIHKYYPEKKLEQIVVLYDASTEYADRSILEQYHPAILVFTLPQVQPGEVEHSLSSHSQDTPASIWKAYLGLRFIKLPDGRTVCPQLDRDSGRCTIHEHKPLVCRTYPHVLDDAGKLARLEKVRCRKPWGNPEDLTFEDYERIRNMVVWAYKAHDQFIQEVIEWNKNPRDKTLADFFRFALQPHPGDEILFPP